MLDGANQNLVVYKSGGHEFMHGLPVDNGDILAVFPCSASLKPLPENYFDEEDCMDYEQISDFEINSMVAKVSFDTFAACHDGSGVNGVVRVDGVEFNPCNNPSDAWPIVTENHIHICFGSELATAKIFTCTELIDVVDKNPLRAAMICFLKMKDAKK